MSGPKAASYEVLENRRRIERARREALESLHKVRRQARQIIDEIETARRDYGDKLQALDAQIGPSIDERADPGQINADIRRLRQLCRRWKSELTLAVLQARVVDLLGDLSTRPTTLSKLRAVPARRRAQRSTPDRATKAAMARAQRIQHALGYLKCPEASAASAQLLELPRKILACDESDRVDSLFSDLNARVQAANASFREAEANEREVQELLEGLQGLEGPEINRALFLLQQVKDGHSVLSQEIRHRVVAAREKTQAQADRAYAAEVIRRAFEELGYEVEEGFSSAVFDGGTAQISRPQNRGYAARLSANQGDSQLEFRMIRFVQPNELPQAEQRIRDREIEEAWCHDYAAASALMQGAGIGWETLRRVAPGQVPVEVVEDARGHRAAAKSREFISNHVPLEDTSES